jgi:YVTN family beta-propeller protein
VAPAPAAEPSPFPFIPPCAARIHDRTLAPTGPTALLASLPLHAAPFAYVPNEGSGTVSVIDIAGDLVVAEIAAGSKPRGLAAGIDHRWLYVSDQPNNRLPLIDLVGRKPAGTVALGESPAFARGTWRSPRTAASCTSPTAVPTTSR